MKQTLRTVMRRRGRCWAADAGQWTGDSAKPGRTQEDSAVLLSARADLGPPGGGAGGKDGLAAEEIQKRFSRGRPLGDNRAQIWGVAPAGHSLQSGSGKVRVEPAIWPATNPEILSEFKAIGAATSLEEQTGLRNFGERPVFLD